MIDFSIEVDCLQMIVKACNTTHVHVLVKLELKYMYNHGVTIATLFCLERHLDLGHAPGSLRIDNVWPQTALG